MAAFINYPFNFPTGRMPVAATAVVALSSHPGESPLAWRVQYISAEGKKALNAETRAKMERFLREERSRDIECRLIEETEGR